MYIGLIFSKMHEISHNYNHVQFSNLDEQQIYLYITDDFGLSTCIVTDWYDSYRRFSH